MKIVFKRFAIGLFHNFIFMAKKGAGMFWDGGGGCDNLSLYWDP